LGIVVDRRCRKRAAFRKAALFVSHAFLHCSYTKTGDKKSLLSPVIGYEITIKFRAIGKIQCTKCPVIVNNAVQNDTTPIWG
jgi:hypothetical protein